MRNIVSKLIFVALFCSSQGELLLSEPISKSFDSVKSQNEIEEFNKLLSKRAIGIYPQPFGGFPQSIFNRPEPLWKATAILQPGTDIEGGPSGVVDFRPIGPNGLITVTVNGTGFAVGKHAVHIHVFGDLSQGCKSTGPHMLNNFIGNVEAKEGGTISSTFSSPFVTVFGVNGILGRSVVIHEKSIDINPSITPYFASPSFSVQSEEKQVGLALACGSIIFANNLV